MGMTRITIVVTPAPSYDLTMVEFVKADLNISDSSEDVFLRRAITRASADISQFCNRTLVKEKMQDVFLPAKEPFQWQLRNYEAALQLSRWPIVSVVSVVENNVTLTENTDFITDQTNGQLIRLDASGNPRRWYLLPVTVVYFGGYSPVPADLEGACARLVKARRAARTRDPNLRSENIPGVRSVTYQTTEGVATGNIPDEIADAVDNYRVPVIA